ncbi:MAG: hypothetical protein AB7P97_20390 [Hyphomonadaceae bacterium]
MGGISGPGGGASPVSTFTAAADGSGIQVGETYIISKPADSQFDTAVIAIDPDLQVQNVPAGQYSFSAFCVFTGGAGGCRAGIFPAGAYALGISSCGGGAVGAGFMQSTGGILCSGANEWRLSFSGGVPKPFAGGTIGLAWRINDPAFTGTPSTLLSRSSFQLTRIE